MKIAAVLKEEELEFLKRAHPDEGDVCPVGNLAKLQSFKAEVAVFDPFATKVDPSEDYWSFAKHIKAPLKILAVDKSRMPGVLAKLDDPGNTALVRKEHFSADYSRHYALHIVGKADGIVSTNCAIGDCMRLWGYIDIADREEVNKALEKRFLGRISFQGRGWKYEPVKN